MNEQQKAIDAFLQENKITYAMRYVGETVRDNNWKCDAWRVEFSSGKSWFETDFCTGLGNRKLPNQLKNKTPEFLIRYANMMHLLGRYQPNGQRDRQVLKNAVEALKKPIAPYAADVLYSLILDSSALDMSFDYWCADYGYDADSISASNIYQACCKIAKGLRQVFTSAQVETLRGLLEDY